MALERLFGILQPVSIIRITYPYELENNQITFSTDVRPITCSICYSLYCIGCKHRFGLHYPEISLRDHPYLGCIIPKCLSRAIPFGFYYPEKCVWGHPLEGLYYPEIAVRGPPLVGLYYP